MDRIVLDDKELVLNRVLRLAKEGVSYAEIGKSVGLSRQRVSQICLKHGIVRRPSDVKEDNWKRFWQSKDTHSDECLFQVTGICTCGQSSTTKET